MSSKTRKSFLIKLGSELKTVPLKVLSSFSLQEAIIVIIDTVEEQQRQLLSDAKNTDKLYYGRKIVDALEISLQKLDEKYPSIRSYANSHKTNLNN